MIEISFSSGNTILIQTQTLAVGIALLAMINIRNSDIATRSRENMKRLHDEKNESIRNNIKYQNSIFLIRYAALSIAFILVSISLILIAFGIGRSWMLFFPVSTVILCIEFIVGPITLLINDKEEEVTSRTIIAIHKFEQKISKFMT